MSLYSDIKEVAKDIQKIKEDNIEVVYLLKAVSFLIVCATFAVQYWSLTFEINIETFPRLPAMLNRFLDKYTFGIFIGLIIYKVIGCSILRYFAVKITVKFNIKLLPALDTVEDVFEIATLSILLLKLNKNLFLYIQGMDVIENTDKNIYLTYLICCFWVAVKWLYVKNKNYWYLAEIKYTPYFDHAGRRIAQEDLVIYYGRLYKICFLDEEKGGYSKREWYLTKSERGISYREILLEDAVRDDKGKLKVYEYGMGEKWKW